MLLRTILSIPSLVWITTLSHEIHQIFLPKIFPLKLLWHYELPHGSNKIIPASLLLCALVQFSKTKQKSLTHTLCNFSHFFLISTLSSTASFICFPPWLKKKHIIINVSARNHLSQNWSLLRTMPLAKILLLQVIHSFLFFLIFFIRLQLVQFIGQKWSTDTISNTIFIVFHHTALLLFN